MKQKIAELSKSAWLCWAILAIIAITNVYTVTNLGLGLVIFLLSITFRIVPRSSFLKHSQLQESMVRVTLFGMTVPISTAAFRLVAGMA